MFLVSSALLLYDLLLSNIPSRPFFLLIARLSLTCNTSLLTRIILIVLGLLALTLTLTLTLALPFLHTFSRPNPTFFRIFSHQIQSNVSSGITLNELQDLPLTCEKNNDITITTTCISNGQEIIHANGYDKFTTGTAAGLAVTFCVVMRLISYIALRLIKH
jgi:hypothetical protein